MDDDIVHTIRAFNRRYTSAMNLLRNHYLGSAYSIPEMRILYEIYSNEGCTAVTIVKSTNIDKGYLSRIIRKLEKQDFIRREPAKEDSRSYRLYLTETGISHTREYVRQSDEEISEVISPLTKEEKKRFAASITVIGELLETAEKRRSITNHG